MKRKTSGSMFDELNLTLMKRDNLFTCTARKALVAVRDATPTTELERKTSDSMFDELNSTLRKRDFLWTHPAGKTS